MHPAFLFVLAVMHGMIINNDFQTCANTVKVTFGAEILFLLNLVGDD